jgi:GWxTD domain-containing protein
LLRSDTVTLPTGTPVRAAELHIPIARLGFGVVITSLETSGGAAVGQSAAVITPGVDLPAQTIGDLLDEMRYFASEPELRTIRVASPEVQPVLWQALVKRTDPNPGTPENEALVEYARRVRVATALFSDSTVQGWRTERGGVLAALGEPDAIHQSADADTSTSIRRITWDYRRLRLSLAFFDASGQGRWQLTPTSEAEFRSILSLSGPCVGCR